MRKRISLALSMTLVLAGGLALAVLYKPLATQAKDAILSTESINPLPDGLSNSETESNSPTSEWNQTYGGALDDFAYSVVETADGGYALAGSTASYGAGGDDFWLVKTDAVGNMEWNKTYGVGRHQYARSVIETADSGYAICGTTEAIGPGGVDFWLVKTDQYGNAEWNQSYGGGGEDWSWSVIQTSDTGYAIAGITRSFGAGYSDFWFVKTNSTGHMMWNQSYGGTSDDGARSVVQTGDGGYAIAGSTESFGAGEQDFWLVKTDSAGNMVWNNTYGGAYRDRARSVVETVDGGYALTGDTFSFGAGSWDSWLVKTDSTGNMVWNRTYGRGNSDGTESIVQTSDGGYALAGHTFSFGATDSDFWLVKVDSFGNEQWNRTYGGVGRDRVFSVVVTNDAGYAAAGWTYSYGSGSADFWLVKLASSPPIHDVAVRGMMTSKTVVGVGYSASINVTAVNLGDFTETFDVTLYANATAIGTQTVNDIREGASTILTFTWDTTGLAFGNYTMNAVADYVTGEENLDDNTLFDGDVMITIPGDVNGDCAVNIHDIHSFGKVFNTEPLDPLWVPEADIDDDLIIDTQDLRIINAHYGQSW